MLTLKAKLETVLSERDKERSMEVLQKNPGRVLGRVAEIWGWFFGVIPVSYCGLSI